MADMLSTIQSGLISALDNMTISGGYNSDYDSFQQDDLAKVTTWPLINVYMSPDERALSDQSSPNMNAIRNEVGFTLECFDKMPTEGSNTDFDVDYVLNDMLHDVKRCIGRNPTLGGLVEYIGYRGSTRTIAAPDIMIPKRLIVTINIMYSQDSREPTVLGCV